MAEITNEQIMDVNILLAMNRCMSEIAHNLQYIHTQQVKQRIKHVIKTVDLYDREVKRKLNTDQSQAIEDIYDCIMDLVLEAREVTLKNATNERV
jgi:flagellin-specific chaperone FliS